MNYEGATHDWHHIHEQLLKVSKGKAQLALTEARWLLEAERARIHRRLGYGSFVEYLGMVLGYRAREARERLMVARRLAELPETATALGDGELSWSGVRELSRVVTEDTESEWLAATRDKSVRQIEKMVSGFELGDLPTDAKKQRAERHVLRIEVDGATLATWREAVQKVRAEHGGELSEDQALLSIARMVLEGPKDAGRASYQVAVTICEECGQGSQDGSGEPIAITDEARDMAYCDAQFIGHVDGSGVGGTHVGQPKRGQPARATQTIPPAKRRAVLRRDHGQCVVDGCAASIFIDVHHLRWRTDGGQHDIDGMCVLCSAHHSAAHHGTLRIEGLPSTGMRFLHADGTPYGSRRVGTRAADLNAELFVELKDHGLVASEAWQAVQP